MQTKLHFVEDVMTKKMNDAGHVMRGSSGLSHLQILGGRLEGNKKLGAQKENG